MNKYIDADKLIAKLTKIQFDLNAAYRHPQSDNIVRAISLEYDDIISLVTSLQQEQPEVALTDNASFAKELKRFLSDTENEKKRGGVVLPIIKHFYELGLNARKK